MRNGLRELPSVHSWTGDGFELYADSFIQTQQEMVTVIAIVNV